MPAEPIGTFMITTTTAPAVQRINIVLSGDVDMAALPLLTDAVKQIGEASRAPLSSTL